MPTQYWFSSASLGSYRRTWASDVGQSMAGLNQTVPYAMIWCGRQATTVINPNAQLDLVSTIDGRSIPIQADTICVHGDGPHAVEFARALRQG